MPDSARLLGTRRAVKVTGTIDGHPSPPPSCPRAPPHWLPIRAALCKTIGKSDAGTEVTFHLEQRLS
ncbi:DUF1905 domain-containing protein [Micromonospora sp. M12]